MDEHDTAVQPATAKAATKKSRASKKRREWKAKFLAALMKTGNVSDACAQASVNRSYAYDYRMRDDQFATAWNEAEEIACDALEKEARRRAYAGVTKSVFYKDQIVGEQREYSDVLMIFLLKAHRPAKFRENVRLEHTGPDGGVPTMNLTVKREPHGNQP